MEELRSENQHNRSTLSAHMLYQPSLTVVKAAIGDVMHYAGSEDVAIRQTDKVK